MDLLTSLDPPLKREVSYNKCTCRRDFLRCQKNSRCPDCTRGDKKGAYNRTNSGYFSEAALA